MKDRISLYPGRVKLNPVAGEANTYDMVRADQPTQEGTALNKANLLNDSTATGLHLGGGEPTPDLAFQKMLKNVQVNPYTHIDKPAWTWFEESKLDNFSPYPLVGCFKYIEETNEIISLEAGTLIRISKDYGKTFTTLEKTLSGNPVFVDFYNGTYYFVTQTKLYSTQDKINFTEYNLTYSNIISAEIDKDHENLIYTSTTDSCTFAYAKLSNLSTQTKIYSQNQFGLYGGGAPVSYVNGYIVQTVSFANGYAGTLVIENYWTGTPKTTTYRGWDNADGYIYSKVIFVDGNYYYVLMGGNKLRLVKTSDLLIEPLNSIDFPINTTQSERTRLINVGNIIYCGIQDAQNNNKIYKIEGSNIEDSNFNFSYAKSGFDGIFYIENLEKQNQILIFSGSHYRYETYDKYITEDYLTDMAGNNLTLSPTQSPIHIETGSYTGTDTYGESNPNSLTFGFEPKLVWIYRYVDQNGASYECNATFSPFVKNGNTKYYSISIESTRQVLYGVKWNSNNVIWHHDTNADYQLNASGVKYYYIAIG